MNSQLRGTWLYDLLTANGFDVVISNPAKTKAIASAKIKNDRVESHMLAQLLRADLIPTVCVSPLQVRKLKGLIWHRQRLVNDGTRKKNRIHALLKKNNKAKLFNAIIIVAEVGDISRFRSYCNLTSYTGLVPSLDASGGKQRMGSITKQGSRYLRTALVEAANAIPRIKHLLARYVSLFPVFLAPCSLFLVLMRSYS